MQMQTQKYAKRNFRPHQGNAVRITSAGLVKVDKEIADALKQNDKARHDSMSKAAGLNYPK